MSLKSTKGLILIVVGLLFLGLPLFASQYVSYLMLTFFCAGHCLLADQMVCTERPLVIRTGQTTCTLQGRIGLPGSVDVQVEVRIGDLEAFTTAFHLPAFTGTARVQATATGNFEDLDLSGEIDRDSLSGPSFVLDSLNAVVHLRHVLRGRSGSVVLAGTDGSVGGIPFRRVDIRLALMDSTIGIDSLSISGEQADLNLAGQLRIGEGLTNLSLDRVQGQHPAALSERHGGLHASWCQVRLPHECARLLKVALPVAFFRFAFPGQPYFLIAAITGILGHDWPIFYGFKGGSGLSPTYGGMLVISPVGVIVTAVGGLLLGLFVFRNAVVLYLAGLWLMIPWLWFTTYDLWYLAYGIIVNILFFVAMIPEIRIVRDYQKRGIGNEVARHGHDADGPHDQQDDETHGLAKQKSPDGAE